MDGLKQMTARVLELSRLPPFIPDPKLPEQRQRILKAREKLENLKRMSLKRRLDEMNSPQIMHPKPHLTVIDQQISNEEEIFILDSEEEESNLNSSNSDEESGTGSEPGSFSDAPSDDGIEESHDSNNDTHNRTMSDIKSDAEEEIVLNHESNHEVRDSDIEDISSQNNDVDKYDKESEGAGDSDIEEMSSQKHDGMDDKESEGTGDSDIEEMSSQKYDGMDDKESEGTGDSDIEDMSSQRHDGMDEDDEDKLDAGNVLEKKENILNTGSSQRRQEDSENVQMSSPKLYNLDEDSSESESSGDSDNEKISFPKPDSVDQNETSPDFQQRAAHVVDADGSFEKLNSNIEENYSAGGSEAGSLLNSKRSTSEKLEALDEDFYSGYSDEPRNLPESSEHFLDPFSMEGASNQRLLESHEVDGLLHSSSSGEMNIADSDAETSSI